MNWYKQIKTSIKDESIADIAYDEWKESSFESNVGTIIHRIYHIGVPADAKRQEIEERIDEVVKELSLEDGELRLWHKVIKDKKYFSKIKGRVVKTYKDKVKAIEKAKRGPLQINTPQTPSNPGGGGAGGGGKMLM